MSIPTLDEAQERELFRLWNYYLAEARRCEKAEAYLAGCTMVAAALEAMLMLMVNAHSDVVEKMKECPKYIGGIKPLIDWNLGQLLAVAKAAHWLPSTLNPQTDEWSDGKARIGDYAEISRLVRNLIHAGNYVKNHPRKRVTARYLAAQFEILDACAGWLEEHNAQRLLEAMRAEGIEVESE
jgi:hypothetical protein